MTWVMGGKASQTYDMLHLMSTSGAYYNWNSALHALQVEQKWISFVLKKIKSRCFEIITDCNASLNVSLVKV